MIEKDKLTDLYLNQNLSAYDIANLFNVGSTTIYRYLNKYKIPIRSKNECQQKYFYNKDFFKKPTLENCYIAGLIASDGNIHKLSKDSYVFTIGFNEEDKILLEEFKNHVNFTGPIKTYPCYCKSNKIKRNTSKCVINNIKDNWLIDLYKWWNITEDKSLTLKPPNITNLNLCLAYIIGYIDGDGSISLRKILNRKPFLEFSIAGTYSNLSWIEDKIFQLESNYNNKKLEQHKNIYCLRYNQIRAYKILSKLNNIPVPFKLSRKWNKIQEYEQLICQNN